MSVDARSKCSPGVALLSAASIKGNRLHEITEGAFAARRSLCGRASGRAQTSTQLSKQRPWQAKYRSSLAAHNTPGPFWGGRRAHAAPPPPAPAPKPTQPPTAAPKPPQPLRLDPSLKRLHDELVAQKADPSILKDWTTEKRKDGPNRGDRVYYVDPHGKAHRSAPAARRAILQTGPVTPPKKRKTQDKDRSQLVKWKLSGCTVAVTPAPPRTEASESELALEGKVFEDEGIRWRVDEVYFDEDVKALCASYYDFDARCAVSCHRTTRTHLRSHSLGGVADVRGLGLRPTSTDGV